MDWLSMLVSIILWKHSCRARETARSRHRVRDARVGHGETLRVLLPRRRLFLLFPALCRLALMRVVIFNPSNSFDTRLVVFRLLLVSPI